MSWEQIPGWAAFTNTYDEYVEQAQDGDVVVEIGCLFGKSLAYLARKLIDKGKDVTIYGVDPWTWESTEEATQHPVMKLAKELGGPFSAFVTTMKAHAPEEFEYCKYIRATSLEARAFFRDQSLAMVLIDGDHSFEGCAADINAWRSSVRIGGMLAGDDYCPRGFPLVVRAVDATLGAKNVNIDGTTWRYRVEENQIKGEWVVVETVGGARWCGQLQSGTEGAAVTLRPAYEMAPTKLMFPKPIGGHGYELAGIDIEPVCWAPLDFAASTPSASLRWASIVRVAELRQDDQQRFFAMIKTASARLPEGVTVG